MKCCICSDLDDIIDYSGIDCCGDEIAYIGLGVDEGLDVWNRESGIRNRESISIGFHIGVLIDMD
jgi:hypothetical protein